MRGDDGAVTLLAHRPGPGPPGARPAPARPRRGRRGAPRRSATTSRGGGSPSSASGFWQVHPHAAADASPPRCSTCCAPHRARPCWTSTRAPACSRRPWPTRSARAGGCIGIESNQQAVADARPTWPTGPGPRSAASASTRARWPGSTCGPTSSCSTRREPAPGRRSWRRSSALGPRAVGYVACDPAALARDVRAAVDAGWTLGALRAFDAFPMTHHVECVALLVPAAGVEPGLAAGESATPSAADAQRRDGDTPSPYDSGL